MSDSTIKTRIFYSWQSDLPDEHNKILIRNALNQATVELAKGKDHHFTCDESCRNSPGSRNIKDDIFDKISQADIFVCDISKTHECKNHKKEVRKYCNPNIAIELGYAIRELGWDRIILIFNNGYGDVGKDLPFDANGHHTLSYKCNDPSHVDNARGSLRKDLESKITDTHTSNPEREISTPVSQDDINHQRDLKMLNDMAGFLHMSTISRFIELSEKSKLTHIGVDFGESLERFVHSHNFTIYDPELKTKILLLSQCWSELIAYAKYINHTTKSDFAYYPLPGDVYRSKQDKEVIENTRNRVPAFSQSVSELKTYIMQKFPEIDFSTFGNDIVKNYHSNI